MSQAEELLNGMSEEVPVHTHPVSDTDTYFVIDPVTRKIENTNPKKHVIMQYDHNSERCTFELPRFIDGHDMLECTSVTVNVDNIEVVEVDDIESETGNVNSDAPDMTDLRIHPDDPEKVISSWLISRNSTQLAGILSFHIEYKCVDSDGNVVYEWSTDNYDEYEIRARKKNGEAAVAGHSDLLEQWRTRIFGAGDSVMANIAAEGEAQVAAVKAESETQQEAVELKGAQTLDSIPEDYTEVNTMADEAVRSKGDAIVCEVSGKTLGFADASNNYIRGLKVFGKSTQDGTPTPDNPVEIVSVENPIVSLYGKNLIEFNHEHNRLASTVGTVIEILENGIIAEGAAGSNPGAQSYSNGWYQICYKKPIRLTVGQVVTASLDYTVLDNPHSTTTDVAFIICPKDGTTNMDGAVKRPADGVTTRLSRTITALEDGEYHITIGLNSCKVRIENIQLEFGGAATHFEHYKPAQTIAVQYTLPGIPVTSGGNYTDENGQQWICDEVDLERGVYVQRLHIDTVSSERINSVDNAYVSTGGSIAYFVPAYQHMQNDDVLLVMSNWCTGIPCKERNTHTDEYRCYAPASDPNVVTLRYPISAGEKTLEEAKVDFSGRSVMYVLREPIESPLTAEEITAFKALRTNYPNTTILNDAGAWMSVKYNADTKTYIDEPKVLKLVDSSTGVVYELKIVNGSLTVNPV